MLLVRRKEKIFITQELHICNSNGTLCVLYSIPLGHTLMENETMGLLKNCISRLSSVQHWLWSHYSRPSLSESTNIKGGFWSVSNHHQRNSNLSTLVARKRQEDKDLEFEISFAHAENQIRTQQRRVELLLL